MLLVLFVIHSRKSHLEFLILCDYSFEVWRGFRRNVEKVVIVLHQLLTAFLKNKTEIKHIQIHSFNRVVNCVFKWILTSVAIAQPSPYLTPKAHTYTCTQKHIVTKIPSKDRDRCSKNKTCVAHLLFSTTNLTLPATGFYILLIETHGCDTICSLKMVSVCSIC